MNKDLVLLGSMAAAMVAIPLAVVAAAGLRLPPSAAALPQSVYPAASPAQAVSAAALQPAAETDSAPVCADLDSFRLLLADGSVAVLPALDYIRGVLAAEMPADSHIEALKAQAVAAYTVSVYEAKRQRADPDPALSGADFAAGAVSHQAYRTEAEAREIFGSSFDYQWDRLTEAAATGVSHLLIYDGEPILAAYHAISAGKTESSGNVWNGELPYLAGVDSSWDMLAPGYISTVAFTKAELEALLIENGFAPQGPLAGWITVGERSAAGYVTQAQVCGEPLSGAGLRSLLGLRSTAFEITCNAQTMVFEVKGYGHGAGLSQNGSDYLARQGSRYAEILAHYYPGAVLIP